MTSSESAIRQFWNARCAAELDSLGVPAAPLRGHDDRVGLELYRRRVHRDDVVMVRDQTRAEVVDRCLREIGNVRQIALHVSVPAESPTPTLVTIDAGPSLRETLARLIETYEDVVVLVPETGVLLSIGPDDEPSGRYEVGIAGGKPVVLGLSERWWRLRGRTEPDAVARRVAIRAELGKEIGPEHPLHLAIDQVEASLPGRDDVVVRLLDGTFALVHPTWSGRREAPPFPTTVLLGAAEAATAALADWEQRW